MANEIIYFAVKSIGLSKINGRKPCSLKDAARHNLREIQAEMGAIGRINSLKTINNWVMAGSSDADGVVSLAQKTFATAGIDLSQKRRDRCQAIELVFSLPSKSEIEPAQYFEKCLHWVERAYELPLLSAVVHTDESAPHCHVLLLPLNREGRYVGSAPLEKPETKKKTESFFAQVAGPAGLNRQGAKLRGGIKQAAICVVLDKCGVLGLPDANGPLWPVFEAGIKRDPAPALEALSIDRQAISDAYKLQLINQANPIGIEAITPKAQTLSCVEIDRLPSSAKVPKASKPPNINRLKVAKEAQQTAEVKNFLKERQTPKVVAVKRSPDDGLTRVKDEYAHDLSAWAD
jgi:hypothetical protein